MSHSRRQFLLASTALAALQRISPAHAGFAGGLNLFGASAGTQTFVSIALDNSSFAGGSGAGTVVGNITVTMNTGSFTGTLSVIGADQAKFQIVGTQLQLATTVANGVYSISIRATQDGATNTPFDQPETITGSSLNAQPTLVNNGGSTMGNGTVSPMFTLAFRKGDIPAACKTTGSISSGSPTLTVVSATGIAANQYVGMSGLPGNTRVVSVVGTTVTLSKNATTNLVAGTEVVFFGTPLLSVSGTSQPASFGCHVPWSDGSLKLCCVMFRTTFSLIAGASQAITVTTGGTPPSRDVRSLATDVYAQSIIVTATGAKNGATNITNAGLVGVLGSWLDSAANTNNNNWQQNVYCDGDAGTVWGVTCHMSTTKTGAANGQLECTHYIQALTDNSGNLGSFRYLPCIRQPWYDKGASNNALFFDYEAAPLKWQYGSGPTSVNWTWPHGSHTVTASGGTLTTDTANNYWCGCDPGHGVTFMPCYFKNTACGFTANTIYWLGSNTSTNKVLVIYDYSYNRVTPTNGTNTIVPLPFSNPFGRFYSATSNGKYTEFNGTGSGNTGSAYDLQVRMDKSYYHSAGLLPPYDLSLSITGDYGFFSSGAYTDYSPQTVGDFGTTESSGSGDPPSIGPLPNGCAFHFQSPNATNEKFVRMVGLGGGNWQIDFRDWAGGGQIPNCNNATYAGMPAYRSGNLPQWNGNGNLSAGFTNPTYWTTWCVLDLEHRGNTNYYPYLVTGEPHNYDMVLEEGSSCIIAPHNGGDRDFTSPTNAYACIIGTKDEPRAIAWGVRGVVLAAITVAMSDVDGSQRYKYWHDVANTNMNWAPNVALNNANGYYTTNGTINSWVCNNGMWYPGQYRAGVTYASPWQYSFIRFGFCWAAKALENADALTFLQKMVTRDNYVDSLGGGWLQHAYYNPSSDETVNTCGITTGNVVGSDLQFGASVSGFIFTSVSWTSTSPHFTVTGATNNPPHVNDTFYFNACSSPPAAISPSQGYYLINLTNVGGGTYTFDLSATPSPGSAVNVTTTGSPPSGGLNRVYYKATSPPAASTGQWAGIGVTGGTTAGSICAIDYCAELWGQACGDGGSTSISNDAHTRLTSGGNGWATDILSNPKYAVQATF